MIDLDVRLSQRMRIAEKPRPLRTVAVLLAHSGDSWFWLAGLLLVWFFGPVYWKDRSLILILSILATALLVFVIKFSIRRKRPEGEWGKVYRQTDPHSFPSGHAVRAMMLAVVILGLGPVWLGFLLLGWSFLVGLARVGMGVHYLSDVVAGMIIGLVIGLSVLLIV